MSNAAKKTKEFYRLQFDVRQAQLNIIEGLVAICGLSSKKELFSNAMSLMKWAVSETQKGRRIASYDPERDEIEVVALPALDLIQQPDAMHYSAEKTQEHLQRTESAQRRFGAGKAKLGVV